MKIKQQSWLALRIAAILTTLATVFIGWGFTFGVSPVAAAGSLGTWQNRTLIRVDYSKIDATLANFPVLVHISPSSGTNSADLSSIFTNLGSDANRKKIAVTTADGTTQCYVEEESWNTATKQAYLWVKVPQISAGAETALYLYYDAAQPDNTAYVGDVGSAAGDAVWNSNFAGVWHLNGSYTGAAGQVLDSTANNNNGTAYGTGGLPTQQASAIGSGQYFSGNTGTTGGTRPYISIPDAASYSPAATGQLTVSWWYLPTVTDNYSSTGGEMDYINMLGKGLWGKQTEWEWTLGGQNSPNKPWEIAFYAQSLDGGLGNGGGIYKVWHPGIDKIYCVGTIDLAGNLIRIELFYPDGTVGIDTNNFNGLTIAPGTGPIMIGTGWASNPDQAYKGNLDELEISKVVQSDAWNKASYYSESDKLLSYGDSTTAYQQVFASFTADNGSTGYGGAQWRGQTFTPATTHTLQQVRLKLLGSGSPSGNLNVAIRATDASGLPTGANLSTGSIAVSSLGSSAFAVYPINMTDVTVNAGTKYAVIWSAPGMSAGGLSYRVKSPATSADYAGGCLVDSSSSGSSWSNNPSYEAYFEEWGIIPLGTPVNHAPVLSATANQSVTAGQPLSFTVSGSDQDGDSLIYSASSLPGGAAFNASTRTFSWTPTTAQVGTYSVNFLVSDGSLSASQTAGITVSATQVNRAPVLNTIANQTVIAGQPLTFTVSGSDPDGNTLTYSAANLPSGATFNASTKTFSWTPTTAQAGTYSNVTFQVSDGSLSATQAISIIVNSTVGVASPFAAFTADNSGTNFGGANWRGQSFTPATTSTLQSVTLKLLGGTTPTGNVNVVIRATDAGGLPTGANLSSGSIPCSSVSASAYATYSIPMSSVTLNAGAKYAVLWSAPNMATGSMSYRVKNPATSADYAGGNLVDSGNSGSSWSNNPTYEAYFQAWGTTSGAVNQPPALGSIGNQSVAAGQTLSFTISGSDPDGNALTYSAANLPGGATFNPSTRVFSWTPTTSQAGTYSSITFQVSDAMLADSEAISITVAAVNQPPLLNPVANQTVTAGQTLSFTVSGSDPDGNALTYSATNLPVGATFNAATRTFFWTPTTSQAGTYSTVTFQVSDGSLTASQSISITVVNHAPVLNPVANQTVTAGQSLSFSISGSDPDGGTLTYSASNLPSGATFNASTRTFSWTPTTSQAGACSVNFTVSDGSLTASQSVGITVNALVNHSPVINPIGNQTVGAGQTLTFTVSASDQDGGTLTYSAANLPSGATFNTTTHVFSWTPASGQAGTYSSVTFMVYDGSLTATQVITITVNAAPSTSLFASFTADNSNTNFGGVNWRGETFTPSATHTLQSVSLKLLGTASPSGNVNVAIRATDASGMPTGANLSTGSILASSVSSKSYAVYSVNMTPVVLKAGTKYAIIWSAPGVAKGGMSYRVKNPSTSADYAGGNLVDSGNSGSTWSNDPAYRAYFQEWGV